MKEEISVVDVRQGKPSASGMQRLALCPGSWLAERGLPDVPGEAALMGTRLHAHMEHGSLPEDAAEAEAVAWCREQEVALAERFLGWDGVAEADPASPDGRVLRELRWWHGDLFSGQADVVFVANGMALVLDYKFGRVPVAAAECNLQLAALALLAFENLPGVEVVFCGILQPLVSRQVPGVVRFRREMLPQLCAYFDGLVAAAQRPDAPRVPGGAQCRFCRAQVDCPACGGLVQQQAQVADVAAAWADWSPERKAQALELAGLAERWAEAVRRRAKADLKEGLDIPGWSLSAGRKCFKVHDATGAFAVLQDELGLPPAVFAGCCSVSISALDRAVHGLLAERAAADGRKQRVKDSAAWLRELLVRCECGAESVSEGALKCEL